MRISVNEFRKNIAKYLKSKEVIEIYRYNKVIAKLEVLNTPIDFSPKPREPQSFLELPEKEQKRIIIKAAKESNKAQKKIADTYKKLERLASPTTSGGTTVTPKDVKRGADALKEISKLPQPPQMYGCGCKRVDGKVLCPKHHRL